MFNVQVALPSPHLRDYVREYVFRDERFEAGPVTRPVTARFEILLVFQFDAPIEAFEFHTGRPRFLPTPLIVGAQTGRRADLRLRGHSAVFFVCFQPAGFHRLFHLPAEAVTNQALDARDVIGPEATEIFARLAQAPTMTDRVAAIEGFLLTRARSARPFHPTAIAAATLVRSHGRTRVADLVRDSGLSDRHFARRFTEQMGLPPKLFARVVRVHFALGLKERRPALTWADVSQRAGYFDQTHLVKDFKALVGAAPSSFVRLAPPIAPELLDLS